MCYVGGDQQIREFFSPVDEVGSQNQRSTPCSREKDLDHRRVEGRDAGWRHHRDRVRARRQDRRPGADVSRRHLHGGGQPRRPARPVAPRRLRRRPFQGAGALRLLHHQNTLHTGSEARGADIRRAEILDDTARDIDDATLDHVLGSGYGIFAGAPKDWAELTFSAARAGWVQHEVWHPQQQGRWHDDGRYELKLPYVQETEVVMDVLRHGAEVQVLSPPALVKRVREALAAAQQVYR